MLTRLAIADVGVTGHNMSKQETTESYSVSPRRRNSLAGTSHRRRVTGHTYAARRASCSYTGIIPASVPHLRLLLETFKKRSTNPRSSRALAPGRLQSPGTHLVFVHP